jgi:poly(3-hydroxybutyrate) depolymerase
VFDNLLSIAPRRIGGSDLSLTPDTSSTALTWTPAASDHAWLDVGAAVGGRNGRVAYAGLALDVQTRGARYLFVGSDDALSVRLDGREVLRRTAARSSHDDQDVLRLDLTPGRHTLVVKMASRGDLDLFVRLTDLSLRPDPTVRFELPLVGDAPCRALARRAVSLSLSRHVVAEGTRIDLDVAFRGGAAYVEGSAEQPVRVVINRGAASTTGALTVRPSEGLSWHDVVPSGEPATVLVDLDGRTQRFNVTVSPEVRAALLRAREVLPPLDAAFRSPLALTPVAPPRASDALPAGSIWSVERSAERLEALVAEGDPDAAYLASEATLLNTLLDAVAEGRDPYADRRGALRRAYRSPLDGTLQEYSVFVPPSYRATRATPSITVLHGLGGTAHRMLAILSGFFDDDETRTHADRYLPPIEDKGVIYIAPYGFGDTGYRQQGEHDVLAVLDDVRRAYNLDADRTYMTGLSMGGIGAAGVPFHHPDVYASIASLCGYHSYFVRNDTRGVRRPWEVFLMELRSNAHYAENGLHMPLYVVQGTLDRPITNSTVLTERYTALGYSLRSEFPALDHNVWSTTYENSRIVPYFAAHRRVAVPRTIRFRTPELRWNRAWWVTVDALTSPSPGATQRTGRWADVQLSSTRGAVGQGSTRNVAALTLAPPRSAYDASARHLTLTLDGERLELPFDVPTTLLRDGAHWRVGSRPTMRGGGPIREIFDTPVLFVTSTADPVEARACERAARHWANRWGVRTRYPIVRDDSYTEAMGEGRTLVLLGRSNRILARMADRLPLRIAADAVTFGERRFEGVDVGAVFSTHDPDRPERTVLVIAGTTALATLFSRALPDLVPEYVIYDGHIAPARGRVILGPDALVLAAGFFDDAGRAVGPDNDPVSDNRAARARP